MRRPNNLGKQVRGTRQQKKAQTRRGQSIGTYRLISGPRSFDVTRNDIKYKRNRTSGQRQTFELLRTQTILVFVSQGRTNTEQRIAETDFKMDGNDENSAWCVTAGAHCPDQRGYKYPTSPPTIVPQIN